ncbi:hypothetical protein EV715DRAFT_259034 [Schizophyllum commune]
MKFALVASALSAAVVLAAPAEQDCNNVDNCYGGIHGWGGYVPVAPYQANLYTACRNDDVALGGTGNLWGSKPCVALATSSLKIGPENLQNVLSCDNQNLTCIWQEPHLDYNIYAGIVGDCAWQPNGCPITQQNYIDFIYGTLSEIGSGDWPSSVDTLLSEGWQPLLDWAKTGETIPYTNFDDFLHYG